MISRVWRGKTSIERADEYEDFLRRTAYPDYGGVEGNRGWILLRRADGDAVEFMFVSFWESMDALRRYAGDDTERPKWKELWTKMLMASILFICVPWGIYFYQRSTGLTISTRSGPGRISTSEDLSWTFDRAFAMTIAALPVLVLSAIKRRQHL